MVISKKIISFFLLFFAISLFAVDNNTVYNKLIDKYSKIHTFSAEFTQMNYWKEIDDSLLSKGKIFYDNDKMLLIYSEPKKQKVLVDTTSVLVWDIQEKQAYKTENNTNISKPIDIIKRFWGKSKIQIEKKKNMLSITLVSDEQTINVSLKNYIIVKITVKNEDSIVTYKFNKIKINPKIDKNILRIILPEDVKLIQN